MQDVVEYINANRGRFTREAIGEQLLAAGHDRRTIAEAWEASDASARAAEAGLTARPRYGLFSAAVIVIGVMGMFVLGGESPYVFIVAIAYLIGVTVCLGVGIGLVRLVDGGHWRVAAGLLVALIAVMGVSVVSMAQSGALFSLSPSLALLVAGGVALVLVLARRGAPREVNAVAYALPLVGWMAATGSCLAIAGSM